MVSLIKIRSAVPFCVATETERRERDAATRSSVVFYSGMNGAFAQFMATGTVSLD